MWESRCIFKKRSILEQFCHAITQFWKTVFAALRGKELYYQIMEGRTFLSYPGFLLKSISDVHRFFCSGKFFHSSTLWRTDHLEGYVKKKNPILWLDLFWHFLIQSFKSIAPLLHDCDLGAPSLHLQLSAHVSECLVIWFSITWRNIWFKMHSPTLSSVMHCWLTQSDLWLQLLWEAVTKDVLFLLCSLEISLFS